MVITFVFYQVTCIVMPAEQLTHLFTWKMRLPSSVLSAVQERFETLIIIVIINDQVKVTLSVMDNSFRGTVYNQV